MQRFASLAGSSSRFIRAIAVNHLKNDRSLCEQGVKLCNMNNLIFKRCLSTKNKDSKNSNEIDTHADMYKPSTTKQETHVPDDLKNHHQSPDTINTTLNTTQLRGENVWSTQDSDNVHVGPLGRGKRTKFVSTSSENGSHNHQTTVYTTQGELNIADPFTTHKLQPEATPAKLAEAAAVSAFETFAPDTPLTSTPGAEAVFAPKISSTDVYSTTTSPTADFESTIPSESSSGEPVRYETAAKGKVFGGQDTSADSKKHPNENPFQLGDNKAKQAK